MVGTDGGWQEASTIMLADLFLCQLVEQCVHPQKADLKAASEVPPNDSKGSGSMTATYDTASKKLCYKGSYSGLTGPATAAHCHGPAETWQ